MLALRLDSRNVLVCPDDFLQRVLLCQPARVSGLFGPPAKTARGAGTPSKTPRHDTPVVLGSPDGAPGHSVPTTPVNSLLYSREDEHKPIRITNEHVVEGEVLVDSGYMSVRAGAAHAPVSRISRRTGWPSTSNCLRYESSTARRKKGAHVSRSSSELRWTYSSDRRPPHTRR